MTEDEPKYCFVYDLDSSPMSEDNKLLVCGQLAYDNAVGVAVSPLNEDEDFTPVDSLVAIPWHRIGFMVMVPLDQAVEALRAGEKPKFMN